MAGSTPEDFIASGICYLGESAKSFGFISSTHAVITAMLGADGGGG